MRRLLGVALVLCLTAIGCSDTTQPSLDESTQQNSSDNTAIPREPSSRSLERYIVVFDDSVNDPAQKAQGLASQYGGVVQCVYDTAIKGFCANLPTQSLGDLRGSQNVLSVVPDEPVQVFGLSMSNQTDPPSWGLDRVDQVDLPLNQEFNYNRDGTGVNIYIVDSGVRRSHADFGGRVEYVSGGLNGNFAADGQLDADDCYGHGTAVAAVAAGQSFGVAKDAKIWAVRVLDCDGWGYASMAIAAVDWITKLGQLPAVVNMSLGYGAVAPLTVAVENSVAAGFIYTVASGNSIVPLDACDGSPSNATGAITVGATNIDDLEAQWSNYGACVDILAPGASIPSADHNSDSDTSVRSGTSMAAPHVAGRVALYLEDHTTATPDLVLAVIQANATQGRIALHPSSAAGGTPNLLVNTDPIPNMAPTAVVLQSCSDRMCTFSAAQSFDIDGRVDGYYWDFGDGSTAAGITASHVYAADGTYTVTLTVVDAQGLSTDESVAVTVEETSGSERRDRRERK